MLTQPLNAEPPWFHGLGPFLLRTLPQTRSKITQKASLKEGHSEVLCRNPLPYTPTSSSRKSCLGIKWFPKWERLLLRRRGARWPLSTTPSSLPTPPRPTHPPKTRSWKPHRSILLEGLEIDIVFVLLRLKLHTTYKPRKRSTVASLFGAILALPTLPECCLFKYPITIIALGKNFEVYSLLVCVCH